MPQVSKYQFSVRPERGESVWYNLSIMYTTANGFFIELPKEFNEGFDLLSDDDCKRLGVQFIRKYIGDHKTKRVAFAATENDCKKNIKAVIEHLMNASIVSRKVIVINYDTDSDFQERSDWFHPRIGMFIGFMYLEERSVGEKKSYIRNFKGHHGDSDYYSTHDIRGNDSVIIPDTPENRQFLEDLYDRFKWLRKSLKERFANTDSAMQFISSNQLLLGSVAQSEEE